MDQLFASDVLERLKQLELPFNRYGLDPYGVSRSYLALGYTALTPIYRHYFRCQSHGVENIPPRGRAMLAGNHSGGLPVDGAMILGSLFWEMNPPRIAHGMAEKFIQGVPFLSPLFCRTGMFPGLPENAMRLLQDERLLMVFPEGAAGIGKLYRDRYQLRRFGTGFVRIALRAKAPIIPFAFVGGEEAVPTIYRSDTLAKAFGLPVWPVSPYGLPIPLPLRCDLYYGEAIHFEGDGNESDDVIQDYVQRVRQQVELLIDKGRSERRERIQESSKEAPSREEETE